MRRGRRGLAALLVLALAGWEPFRSPHPDVERGNHAYAEGRWDDAIAAYQAARGSGVDEGGLDYDTGSAQLRKAEALPEGDARKRLREEALEALARAGRARDPQIRGQASYNRANELLKADKLDEAIDAYKDALRALPEMEDARVNLELALKRRQKQQQRQQQNGQGQGQNQNQSPGQGQDQNRPKPSPRGQRPPPPPSPKSPAERKLDALEGSSRGLRREQVRRRSAESFRAPSGPDW